MQAFIDLDHQILLDEILMLMLPTGIIYAYYALPDMWDSLYGALFAGGLMLLIFLLSRGGMGAGDVKLSFVLGVWLGFKASIVLSDAGFCFGGIIGCCCWLPVSSSVKIRFRLDRFYVSELILRFCFSPYLNLFFTGILFV